MAESQVIQAPQGYSLEIYRQMCEYMNINYGQFFIAYGEKIRAYYEALLPNDKYGIINRIKNTICNYLFANGYELTTPYKEVDQLLQEFLFDTNFLEMMILNYPACVLAGNGMLTSIRDPFTGQPEIVYIQDVNYIPIDYLGTNVKTAVWFKDMVKETPEYDANGNMVINPETGEPMLKTKAYIFACKEKPDGREFFLFERNVQTVAPVIYFNPIWTYALGPMTNLQVWGENGHQKFATLSYLQVNPLFMNKPMQVGIMWPKHLYERLYKSIENLDREYNFSSKITVVNENMVETRQVIETMRGTFKEITTKKPLLDREGKLQQITISGNLNDKPAWEFNPVIRFKEFESKLELDAAMLAQAIGFPKDELSNIIQSNFTTATQTIQVNGRSMFMLKPLATNIEHAVSIVLAGILDYFVEDGLLAPEMVPHPSEISFKLRAGVMPDDGARKEWLAKLHAQNVLGPDLLLKKTEDFHPVEMARNLDDLADQRIFIQEEQQDQMARQELQRVKGKLTPQNRNSQLKSIKDTQNSNGNKR